MNPLLAALVQAGVLSRDEADRLNRMLDDDAARAWAEQQIAVAFTRGLQAQRTRIMAALEAQGPAALSADRIWSGEDVLLFRDVAPALTTVASDAAIVASVRSGGLADWNAVNEEVIGWVERYYMSTAADAYGSIPNLNATARQQVGALINQWQRGTLVPEGQRARGMPDLIAAMEDVFGAERGARIGVTEVTRVFSESTRQAALANPNTKYLRWQTGRDEFVCFPAGTMVATWAGDVPIERIVPGQLVLTRQGHRRVKAISRRQYSGGMVTLETAQGVRLTSTANHPIWSEVKQTWLEASDFQVGDTIQLVNHQSDSIRRVLHFGLTNPNHRPSLPVEMLIFGRVAPRWMPVGTVHLDSNHLFWNGEVDTISADSMLLNKCHISSGQGLADSSLKQGFGLRATVAREGAELAIFVARLNPYLFAARLAGDVYRGPAALFGTIPGNPSVLTGRKHLAATLASAFNAFVSALPTANSVAVGNARADREFLTANRADLSHHLRCASGFKASATAIVSLLMELCTGNRATTLHARTGRTGADGIVAGLRTILLAGLRRGSFERLSTANAGANFHHAPRETGERSMTTVYHEPLATAIEVYDIQVEDVPEFYANGVLVHNCPICGPLDGVLVEKGTNFPGGYYPPAHPNCRCAVNEETELTAGIEAGVGGAGPWQSPNGPAAGPTMVPVAPVQVRPQWAPSMPPAEADRWAAGSAIEDELYHVTPAQNVDSLKQDGFDLSRQQFGKLFGNGVYLTTDPTVAATYEKWGAQYGSTQRLRLRANVEKAFDFDVPAILDDRKASTNIPRAILHRLLDLPEFVPVSRLSDAERAAASTWDNVVEAAGKIGVAQPNMPELSAETALCQSVLKHFGYDALSLRVQHGQFSYALGTQHIIFDPRKVVILND